MQSIKVNLRPSQELLQSSSPKIPLQETWNILTLAAEFIYYRPHRNRLKPETVQKIIFLYGCRVRDGGLIHRQQKARERASSFIRYQSISCQIDPSKASEEFTDFLHSLCSWIYLGDDEENEDEDEDEDEEGKDQEDDEDAE